MGFWRTIFKLSGWKVENHVELVDKCVICVAPHTSNLDFPIGLMAYRSMGREANFLMKKFWFFFPLKYLLRGLGGIPVDRSKGHKGSLTADIIERFRTSDYLNLAVTPEGTRSRNPEWKTGFLVIAHGAGVPVILATLDFRSKRAIFMEKFLTTGNIEADLQRVKDTYAHLGANARYPEKFTT